MGEASIADICEVKAREENVMNRKSGTADSAKSSLLGEQDMR